MTSLKDLSTLANTSRPSPISGLLSRLKEHCAGHYDHVVDPSSFLKISEGSTVYAKCARPLASSVLFRIADTLVFTTIDSYSQFRDVWKKVHFSSNAARSELTEHSIPDVGTLINVLESLEDDVTSVRVFHPVMTDCTPYVLYPDDAGTFEAGLYSPERLNGPVYADFRQLGYRRGESPIYMLCPIRDEWTGGVSLEAIEHNCGTTDCLVTPVSAFDPNDTATTLSLDEMDVGMGYQTREAVRQLAAMFITHILAEYTQTEQYENTAVLWDEEDDRFTEARDHDSGITSGALFLFRVFGAKAPALTQLDDYLALYCHLIYSASHALMEMCTPTFRLNHFRLMGYYRPWFGWGWKPAKHTAQADEAWSAPALKCLGVIGTGESRSHAPYTAEEE